MPGKSADSFLIELVQGFDPDSAMPKKGTKLTPEQIGLLRAWIDQGMKWDAGTFGRVEPINLKPREPAVPAGSKGANPVDLILQPYFKAHGIKPTQAVSDRTLPGESTSTSSECYHRLRRWRNLPATNIPTNASALCMPCWLTIPITRNIDISSGTDCQ